MTQVQTTQLCLAETGLFPFVPAYQYSLQPSPIINVLKESSINEKSKQASSGATPPPQEEVSTRLQGKPIVAVSPEKSRSSDPVFTVNIRPPLQGSSEQGEN